MSEAQIEVLMGYIRDHVADKHSERPFMGCPVCAEWARAIHDDAERAFDWARTVPGPAGEVH